MKSLLIFNPILDTLLAASFIGAADFSLVLAVAVLVTEVACFISFKLCLDG